MSLSDTLKPGIKNDTLWVFPQIDIERCHRLAEETGISEMLVKTLYARDITSKEEIEDFISLDLERLHDPFLLSGMQDAVERIGLALNGDQKVGVYSDYDVDGISGAAILYRFFKEIGRECMTIIPDRNDEVFGLTKDHIERFKREGVSLIITVDCGICNAEAVNYSQHEGIDVIITDHHQLPDTLPEAICIIHPFQNGCNYPFKFLSGVGLTFKLVQALSSYLKENPAYSSKVPELQKFSGYVALGTVADIVTLTDENRILVANGLKEITNGFCKGLELLKKTSGFEKKDIVVNDLAFKINPKLNTPGKIDHAEKSFRLLVEDNEEILLPILDEIKELNLKRQKLQAKILQEATEMIEKTVNLNNARVIVLASKDWHTGVLGSVATRLVDKYNRPTILFHVSEKGFAKGSGRSIPAFNLFEGLKKNSHVMSSFGGHKLAVGVTIDAEKIEIFRNALNLTASQEISPAELSPRIRIDLAMDFSFDESSFFQEIARLAPFGIGNPTPVFYNGNVWIYEEPRLIGKHGEHVAITLNDAHGAITVIGYYMADFFEDFDWEGIPFAVLFSPILNSPNKTESIRFFLRKIRPCDEINDGNISD